VQIKNKVIRNCAKLSNAISLTIMLLTYFGQYIVHIYHTFEYMAYKQQINSFVIYCLMTLWVSRVKKKQKLFVWRVIRLPVQTHLGENKNG